MRTVSSRYLQSYYNSCVDHGCLKAPLLEEIGQGPKPFENPAIRFKAEIVINMLRRAEAETGDSQMGLHAGENFKPSTFLDIGLALISSATMTDAMLLNAKYQPLTQELGRTRLETEGEIARIVWRPVFQDAEHLRLLTEAIFAGYAVIGRWLTWLNNRDILAMRFRHSPPAHKKVCEELFACPVHYNEEFDAMEFDVDVATMPFPQANPSLHEYLCKRLDREMDQFGAPLPASQEAFRCVQSMLMDGAPSIGRVAQAMDVSERTLRRRLGAEGTSYRDVLENARREACEIFLRENTKSIAEIAQGLGYSEQSAFTRAFKGWFGYPPSQYTPTDSELATK